MRYKTRDLEAFLVESNRIEGMVGTNLNEIRALEAFLNASAVDVGCLERFVEAIRGGPLRSRPGMNVMVGASVPPPGGPLIVGLLENLLIDIQEGEVSAWQAHLRYEQIHPFMDGNGRSGRALWLRMMDRAPVIGFLHTFYYQTLENAR